MVRPLVVCVLLARARLSLGERVFIAWSGLKGAVPILLATFVPLSEIEQDARIYGIVFVVVAFSVLVQGSLVPYVAGRCKVPMGDRRLTPWDVSVRLEREPSGLSHYVVTEGSRAAGLAVRDLPIGESTWLTLVVHEGAAVQPRGSYVLRPADEVLVSAIRQTKRRSAACSRARAPRRTNAARPLRCETRGVFELRIPKKIRIRMMMMRIRTSTPPPMYINPSLSRVDGKEFPHGGFPNPSLRR